MTKIESILVNIEKFINLLVPLIFAIAFIVFIWGIFQYFIAGAASDEKRQQGRQLAVYGIVGFAIMLSVWGLVNIVTGTLGLGSESTPCLPTFTGACTNTNTNTNTNTDVNNVENNFGEGGGA